MQHENTDDVLSREVSETVPAMAAGSVALMGTANVGHYAS